MEPQKAKDLCLNLLHSETEDEVIDILKKNGFWNNRAVWRPYGDMKNNRSVVGNQQSSAVAALVEKLVNSIDAILIAESFRQNLEPTSPYAPKSMREALEKFFNVKDGLIQSLSASERTRLAERIQLIATGTKENPAYTIIDDGEGQSPDQFSNTFLSLIRDNKTKIPFVQGKFNMGGTGVLQFTGNNSFQLIISKRQPDIPCVDPLYKNFWGFTITRRLEPSPDQPQSMYVYLAPEGEIISFESDSLPIQPGRYPEAYSNELRAGTCIKLWNYKLRGGLKTIATLDLRYELERYLQEPVLPIRIYERRSGYKAHSYDTTVSGLAATIEDNPDNIEFSDSSPIQIANVGNVRLRVLIMKENMNQENSNRYPAGIFFIVNGQLHGEHGKDFISNKTKLDYVKDTMIVVVDCTDLPQLTREDMFMASRDRMRQCDERFSLEESIVEYIKDHPGIRELNARRRQEKMSSSISEEETAKIIQTIIQSDPSLAQLFGKGELIRMPGRDLSAIEPYIGKKFPTYFRIKNEPKEGLIKHCAKNRNCKIEFETDATNDYFDRIDDRGHLEVHGIPILISRSLWNGNAILKFCLPKNTNIGDKFQIEVLVNDISRLDPLNSNFHIQVEEEEIIDTTHTASPPKGTTTIGLPNIREVRRDEWSSFQFNEYSAIQIKSGEDEMLDIAINMDNIYLRNEILRRKKIEPELICYWFKWGLVLLSLGILNHNKRTEQNNNNNNNDEQSTGETIFTKIERASEGLAVTIIPVICQLNKENSTSNDIS